MELQDFLQYALDFETFVELHRVSLTTLLVGLVLGGAVGRFFERRHSFALIDDTVASVFDKPIASFQCSYDEAELQKCIDAGREDSPRKPIADFAVSEFVADQRSYTEAELQKCIDTGREDSPRADDLRKRL